MFPRLLPRRLAAALVGAAALASPPAFAAEVSGLYEAAVPVADREDRARKRGFSDALVAVLVKVSGQRNPGANPVVRGALPRAETYVQQFGYEVVEVPGPSAGAPPLDELRLRAAFDSAAVNDLLGDAGLPVWGRTRPSVVAWVAVERDGVREMVGAEDPLGVGDALVAGASTRGIPVVIPLLDLDDRAAVRVTDVWAGFRDVIEGASARYGVEGALVVRAYQVLPTLWEARWKLMLPGGDREWVSQSATPASLLAEGVGEVADALASRYAGDAFAGTTAGLQVVVGGVQTLEDYARTLGYIGALDEVSNVGVRSVEAGRVVLEVDARGGAEALRRVVSLGQVLLEDPGLQGGALGFTLRR